MGKHNFEFLKFPFRYSFQLITAMISRKLKLVNSWKVLVSLKTGTNPLHKYDLAVAAR